MYRVRSILAFVLALWLAAAPAVTTVYAQDANEQIGELIDFQADDLDEELISESELTEGSNGEDDPVTEEGEDGTEDDTEEDKEDDAQEDDAVSDTVHVQSSGSIINDVPLIYQTDYPDTRYGSGSVATSGCTITDIAMIINYLCGTEVSVPDLAARFRTMDGSHIQRMLAIAYIHGLKATQVYSVSDVRAAAREGKVSVMLMNSKSGFTKNQHTVVVYGVSSSGKLFIHDSNRDNYSNAVLRAGFADGFEVSDLALGFGGAWIFEVRRESTPDDSPYADVKLTDEEKDLIAKLMWREARGECYEGQQAVAEVVLNRLISGRFGKNVRSIIYAQDQFTTAHLLDETTADELQYFLLDRALKGYNVLSTDVFFFSRNAVNKNVWGRIGKHVFCKAY